MKYNLKYLVVTVSCISALLAQGMLTPQVTTAHAAPTAVVAAVGSDASNKVSISPVGIFGIGTIVYGAGSSLVRSRDGVFITFHTSSLTPGTVATAWWVFFNQPKQCFTTPCTVTDLTSNPAAQASLVHAAGRIVELDGTAAYGAFRAVGDTTGAQLGPGLLEPRKAEIHLVIRTHGPALMEPMLTEQLTTFNGGCPPNMCANLQISIHQP